MNFLVDLADLKIEYQGSTLASRRSFIRDNPNLTCRVVRAIVRGVHFFYSRKEESLRILAKFLATDNTEALEEGYRYAKFPPKPYATESAVQAALNYLADRDGRFAQRKPAEFIEPGPLSELDRSGFIDRLYAAQK
jgi:ABC-type nitrate/sulfonate/bicarbonate transport system substrate-binding protein